MSSQPDESIKSSDDSSKSGDPVPAVSAAEPVKGDTEAVAKSDDAVAKVDEPVEKERAVADKPVSDKPVSDKPVSDKPVSDKPVSDKPVSEKSEPADALAADIISESEKAADSTSASDNAGNDFKAGEEARLAKMAKNIEDHKFQPHQAKIFNELLEKTAPDVTVEGRSYKHPVVIDGLLAIGLLLAMAGFTLGVVKIYIVHEAKHDITDRRYPEAIALLNSSPMPGFFQMQGESPEDLLDQAHYLEAIEKLDKDASDQDALKELDLIRPGSRFFEMANNIKGEHAPVSAVTLQGGTEHEATPAEVKAADRPLLPETDSSK